MSSEFKLYSTDDPKVLRELFNVPGTEWAKDINQEQFSEIETDLFVKAGEYGMKPEAFYIAEKKTGKIVATTTVRRTKGFFKDVDRTGGISSIPDPGSIGLQNVTFLLIGFVFTLKEYRNRGLAQILINNVIELVENQIINEHLNKSDPNKPDSFKNMVTNNGQFDRKLASYYLGKKYFWYLYSGADYFYQKFGFKGYPLKYYSIPLSHISEEDELVVNNLLDKGFDESNVGKKLRLLHGSDEKDRELISLILQGVELDIMTELNQNIFHLDLSGGRRSSSSLTHLSDVLAMSKLGSFNDLGSISEKVVSEEDKNPRRKSSVLKMAVPKVSLKPGIGNLDLNFKFEDYCAEKCTGNKEKAVKFNDIKGAIFTNELQQKSYYILWSTLMQTSLFILGMGELKFVIPSESHHPTPVAAPRRRGSSFSGINELGGHNFQDLDMLINVACWVAKNREIKELKSVYFPSNDLPNTIPSTVLHDFFLNYLPKKFESRETEKDSNEEKVKYISSDNIKLLPMLRKFGNSSHEFELDWVNNSMRDWR